MNVWNVASQTSTFNHALPSTTSVSLASHNWDAKIPSGRVYEQVMPGDAIRKDRNHVVLDGGSVPDTSIPQLKAKAELYDLSGLAGSGMNKVKLCAVDAVFNNEGDVVDELNDFLEKHPVGPYDHLSETSREMENLRKKGNTTEADMLKALLQQFAASQGANANAFEQLPALMKLMRQRNKFAHP